MPRPARIWPPTEWRTAAAVTSLLLLVVAAEALAHRRQRLAGEVVQTAGGEPRVQRGGEHRGRDAFVRVEVEHHADVAVAHQSSGDVRTHQPEPDHAELS